MAQPRKKKSAAKSSTGSKKKSSRATKKSSRAKAPAKKASKSTKTPAKSKAVTPKKTRAKAPAKKASKTVRKSKAPARKKRATPKKAAKSKAAKSPTAKKRGKTTARKKETPAVTESPSSSVAEKAQVYATKQRARRKGQPGQNLPAVIAEPPEPTEPTQHLAVPVGEAESEDVITTEPDAMTMGEHFTDLRKHILRAFYGIAIITIAVLFDSNTVHNFLSTPYRDQVGKGNLAVVIAAEPNKTDLADHKLYGVIPQYYREYEVLTPAQTDAPGQETDQSFWEEIAGGTNNWWQADLIVVELRAWPKMADRQKFLNRLASYIKPEQLVVLGSFVPGGDDNVLLNSLPAQLSNGYFLDHRLQPFQFRRNIEDAFRRALGREPGGQFLQLRPGEVFGVYLKMAFLLGLLIGFPWVLYQAWGFVGPAFERSVQRWGVAIILISTVLFWAGVYLAWEKVFGQSLYYLVVMFNFDNTTAQFSISDYYSFFFGFHFGFGIAFQLPIIIVALGRIGIVSSRFLWEKRGIVIVILAITSAILTPPDVLSQFMLLVPLSFLYVISVGLVRIIEKRGR